MIPKWDRRFLELARFIAQWSKDPSTQVGAVVVDSYKRIIATGYNGLPKDVQDLPERLEDRDTKLKLTIHAEINAILFAQRSLRDCTLYTWPFMPCAQCAAKVIQTGIKNVFSLESDNPRWAADMKLSRIIFSEANVNLTLYSELP